MTALLDPWLPHHIPDSLSDAISQQKQPANMSAPTATGSIPANGANGTKAQPPSAAAPRKKPAVSIFAANKKKPVKPAGKPSRPLQPINRPAPVVKAETASAPEGPHQDYPIFIRKRDLDLRYHVMKFQGQNIVNPYDDTQFSRPIRLFRRAAGDKVEVVEAPAAVDPANEAERELMEARRAERQAEREENQKLIAPTGAEAAKPVKKKQQKKYVNYDNDNFPERQKRQQLRYEEARPWHLEDYDRKNIWVGNYEAPLSHQHALLLVEEGGFRMVPVEKYYKFIPTGKFNPMDADEAAKHMNQKFNMPRWALGTKIGRTLALEHAAKESAAQKKAKKRANQDSDSDDAKDVDKGEYQADKDGLDIEWDDMNDFQDDDEGKLFEGGEDEDAKEIEQRIREEMRQAGLGGTGVKDEALDPEEEYRRQQLEELEERKKTKRIRKQLGRREKKNEYLSDSDDNPYSDDSDDDLSIEEEEEDEKKPEDANKLGVQTGDKSGASSRGTNTPTGRLEKKDLSRPNKRPGSPDLSDMSGNESSRKKAKGLNGRPSLKHRLGRGGSGSGSESDTSRASGRPKNKLIGSATGTPNRSRAASPAAPPVVKKEFPTLDQVRAAIPVDGIAIKDLVAKFRSQLPQGTQDDFITLVKQAGQQNKVTKKIVPKIS